MLVNKDFVVEHKLRLIWIAIIFLLIAAPIFLHLDSKPLREWDEARNAINAFEMSQTGNFLVRTYQYQADLWETKPPLLVWFQALGFKLFGYNELAVRLPAALATLILCLFIIYWTYQNFKLSSIGIIASLILVTSWGFIHEHGARTGDHDALLICFSMIALLQIFNYFERSEAKYLKRFFIFFTLAVLSKSIAGFIILPGILVYAFYKKQVLSTLSDKKFWTGLSVSLFFIFSFYIARELKESGYLFSVWHNELLPRYFNRSSQYQYNQNGFWYYYNELKNWQFSYWFPLILPSIIISVSVFQNSLKNLAIFLNIQIVLYFVIISNGSSNFWYDLFLIPLMAMVIGMSIYKVLELLYLAINTHVISKVFVVLFLFIYAFINPYEAIISKVLSNDETSAQVMYGYAFKRFEQTFPNLKSFGVYKPLGYNYPFVYYQMVFNQTKGYQIKSISDLEFIQFTGKLLLLNEQMDDLNKHQRSYKIVLKDQFYTLIEL